MVFKKKGEVYRISPVMSTGSSRVGTAELVGADGDPMSRQARDESMAARIMSDLVYVFVFMTIKREIITLAARAALLERRQNTE